MRRVFPLTAVAVVVLASALAASAATPPRLFGTVGPGFTITLKRNGAKVTKLTPGRFTFVITDKASIHNFNLERETGGKFTLNGRLVHEAQLTTVGFQGTKTFTITLGKGKWKYYCTPHESSMFGFFTVG